MIPSLTKRARTDIERPPLPTDAQLQLLSDSGSFKRAQSYVRSGAVEITARADTQIDAIVSGTEDYSVRRLLGGREAESHCTCPAFAKGIFCKHLIATAIVARDHAISEDEASSDSATPRMATATADSDLRVFLAAQPAERLAGWLTDLAETDPAIERRLRVYQSQHSPRELRKALGRLLRAPRFLDWRASRKFARDLDPVIELLAELTSTDAHNGIELYEYALTRLFKIYEQSDDSGGDIGDRIRELVRRYLDSLVRSTPADAARAKALFELQREDQWSFLPIEEVWSLLDDAGRAVYAKAIEDEFHALLPAHPPRGTGSKADTSGRRSAWRHSQSFVAPLALRGHSCQHGHRSIDVVINNNLPDAPAQAPALSSHQSALFALSHSVESMTDTNPNEVAARSRHVLTGPQSMIDVAMDRVEGFLSQQRDRFVQELSRIGKSR
jgi:hypothetical protein